MAMGLSFQIITTIPKGDFSDYPLSKCGIAVTVINNCTNIAKGYNEAAKTGEYLIFIRPECSLSPDWQFLMQRHLTTLNFMDVNWAVAGCVSVPNKNEISGYAIINGKEHGRPFQRPCACQALDDYMLIVKSRDNVRFDENSTYVGVDICAKYAMMNRKSYVICAPVSVKNVEVKEVAIKKVESIEYLKNKYVELKDYKPLNASRNIAVLLQLFWVDQWTEFESYLINIHQDYDLYVTLTDSNAELEKKIKEFKPKAIIIKVANRGMDVGQVFETMKFILKLKISYNYYLKIHTKASISDWRRELIQPICSSPTIVKNCINVLKLPHVGMIGSKKWIRTMSKGDICTDNNYKIMSEITSSWKNAAIYDNQFIGGTMFWVKGELWECYFNSLNINDITSKFGDGHSSDRVKGTYEHSFERLFGAMVKEYGQQIIGI